MKSSKSTTNFQVCSHPQDRGGRNIARGGVGGDDFPPRKRFGSFVEDGVAAVQEVVVVVVVVVVVIVTVVV